MMTMNPPGRPRSDATEPDPWQAQLDERLAALAAQAEMMIRQQRFDAVAGVIQQARQLCGCANRDDRDGKPFDPDEMLIADLPHEYAMRWGNLFEERLGIRTVAEFLAKAKNVRLFDSLPNFRRESLGTILTLIQQAKQRRSE